MKIAWKQCDYWLKRLFFMLLRRFIRVPGAGLENSPDRNNKQVKLLINIGFRAVSMRFIADIINTLFMPVSAGRPQNLIPFYSRFLDSIIKIFFAQ